jgi:hypothetical protein
MICRAPCSCPSPLLPVFSLLVPSTAAAMVDKVILALRHQVKVLQRQVKGKTH